MRSSARTWKRRCSPRRSAPRSRSTASATRWPAPTSPEASRSSIVVAERMTGWSSQEASGSRLPSVFRILDGDEPRRRFRIRCNRAGPAQAGMHLPPNCILVRRDGFEIPIEDSVAPIHDREGQATGAVIVFRDVSAARAMALQMTHSAQHDFLTGLPNRMLLNDRVSQAIALAPRHDKKVARAVPRSRRLQAHQRFAGPRRRRQAASIGRQAPGAIACAASDTVSRQGGDEFVVLLSEVQRLPRTPPSRRAECCRPWPSRIPSTSTTCTSRPASA